MKAVCVLALLAITGPAFAQTPAEKPSAQNPKPFIYDGPARDGFQAPEPVAIGPSPMLDRAPVRPPTPKASSARPDAKPSPKPVSGIG
jgi:hypothetical protein